MTNFESKTGHINVVYLKGKILQKYPLYKEDRQVGLILSLDVGNHNYPQVVLFQRSARVAGSYKIGDFIFLKGNIQSSFLKNKKVSTTIFVDEILPNNLIADKYYNRFQIRGQVLHTLECRNNKLIVLIRTFTQHTSTMYVCINDLDQRLHCYEKYEPIYIAEGRIDTRRKIDNNGERHYFTNFIAEKILDF